MVPTDLREDSRHGIIRIETVSFDKILDAVNEKRAHATMAEAPR